MQCPQLVQLRKIQAILVAIDGHWEPLLPEDTKAKVIAEIQATLEDLRQCGAAIPSDGVRVNGTLRGPDGQTFTCPAVARGAALDDLWIDFGDGTYREILIIAIPGPYSEVSQDFFKNMTDKPVVHAEAFDFESLQRELTQIAALEKLWCGSRVSDPYGMPGRDPFVPDSKWTHRDWKEAANAIADGFITYFAGKAIFADLTTSLFAQKDPRALTGYNAANGEGSGERVLGWSRLK
tara:strand:- start:120 stop:827 length:708 start_codon:yes stop_codon:yes gene_type:complete